MIINNKKADKGKTQMRVFKYYAPKQIAKYVVAFFKGQFSIEGIGCFVFDSGRVVFSVDMDQEALKMCKEINNHVNTTENKKINKKATELLFENDTIFFQDFHLHWCLSCGFPYT